jgi:hypothetical protein
VINFGIVGTAVLNENDLVVIEVLVIHILLYRVNQIYGVLGYLRGRHLN